MFCPVHPSARTVAIGASRGCFCERANILNVGIEDAIRKRSASGDGGVGDESFAERKKLRVSTQLKEKSADVVGRIRRFSDTLLFDVGPPARITRK
jgi:hypothetical protein